METVYCEVKPSGRCYWFTYSDGDRVTISEMTARRLIREGAQLVRFH